MSEPVFNVQGGTGSVIPFRPQQFEGYKRIPRQHTRWMLEFCQKAFRREPDEMQQFLDVGCGIGDLTREELLPRCLPCRRIVAVDVSAEMVEHAARHSHHEKIEYGKLDIVSDEEVTKFIDEYGHFDRVYSFHTVIWVRDQARALRNVARLLNPLGECLLIFHASVRSFDVNRNLLKMDRWSKYSHVVDEIAPKTQDMNYDERIEYISRLLTEAGLSTSILELPVCTVFDNCSIESVAAGELEEVVSTYTLSFSWRTRRGDRYASLIPLTAVVAEDEKQQFLIDLAQETAKMHSPDVDRLHYRIYIIKASKMKKK